MPNVSALAATKRGPSKAAKLTPRAAQVETPAVMPAPTPDWFDSTELFGTRDVAYLAGVNYSQLDRWDRIHHAIDPAVPATGSGGADRAYTLRQAMEAHLAGQLARSGVPVAVIRRALDNIREEPNLWWWEEIVVVIDRGLDDCNVENLGKVYRAAATAKPGYRVDLRESSAHVLARLEEFEPVEGEPAG